MDKPVKEVSAVILFSPSNTIYIQKRPKGDGFGGLWEFPGGKKKTDEDFKTCAKREILEELGIALDIVDELPLIIHEYPEFIIHLKPYIARWNGKGTLKPVYEYQWITIREFGYFPFPEADRKIIEQLQVNDTVF